MGPQRNAQSLHTRALRSIRERSMFLADGRRDVGQRDDRCPVTMALCTAASRARSASSAALCSASVITTASGPGKTMDTWSSCSQRTTYGGVPSEERTSVIRPRWPGFPRVDPLMTSQSPRCARTAPPPASDKDERTGLVLHNEDRLGRMQPSGLAHGTVFSRILKHALHSRLLGTREGEPKVPMSSSEHSLIPGSTTTSRPLVVSWHLRQPSAAWHRHYRAPEPCPRSSGIRQACPADQ